MSDMIEENTLADLVRISRAREASTAVSVGAADRDSR